MKIWKRALAALLAALTAISLCMPALAMPNTLQEAPQMTGVEEYRNFVQSAQGRSYGNQFYAFLRVMRFMIRSTAAASLLPPP